MPRDWEQAFRTWSKPSSDTEADKQDNAIRMIKDAIWEYVPLRTYDISVFAQGSYRNNTNVKQESDVDICVCCNDTFWSDYTFADYGAVQAGVSDAPYTYNQFKNDVQSALEQKFGKDGVRRGAKAFDVRPNTYRVDADVLAAFAHRRYQKKTPNLLTGGYIYDYSKPVGAEFISDTGIRVVNWPEQHYTYGVLKNKLTGYRFKSAVRVLKNIRYDMDDAGVKAAKAVPSYLIECMLFNVDDRAFEKNSSVELMQSLIVECYKATATDEACRAWLEVNEMKYLFHLTQPWTRTQAHEFFLAAWGYCEFK